MNASMSRFGDFLRNLTELIFSRDTNNSAKRIPNFLTIRKTNNEPAVIATSAIKAPANTPNAYPDAISKGPPGSIATTTCKNIAIMKDNMLQGFFSHIYARKASGSFAITNIGLQNIYDATPTITRIANKSSIARTRFIIEGLPSVLFFCIVNFNLKKALLQSSVVSLVSPVILIPDVTLNGIPVAACKCSSIINVNVH